MSPIQGVTLGRGGAEHDAADAAIASFSNQIFDSDPQDAYQWSESIRDNNQRQGEMVNLLNRWMQADPATAAAIVQKSSLSDDQKSQLLQQGQH